MNMTQEQADELNRLKKQITEIDEKIAELETKLYVLQKKKRKK